MRFLVESEKPPNDDEEELVDYGDKFEDNSINLEFGQVHSQTSNPYDIS